MEMTKPGSSPGPLRAEAEPTTPLRILVVDDSFENARLLSMMLDLLGHESRFMTDVASALAILPTDTPDVIISDICMEGLDGLHLARTVRSDPAYKAVTLVVHSGRCDAGGKERAMEAGFDFYLVKPAEPSTLEDLLAKITSSRKSGP